MKAYDCIVIGAGHNGLTTAATLAKAGRKVLLVERSDKVGGLAASHEFHPGFKTCGMLHDSSNVQAYVAQNLKLSAYGLQFENESPGIFTPSSEGRGMVVYPDSKRSQTEIAPYSAKDAGQYQKYRQFFERVKPFLEKVFTLSPPEVYSLNFYGLWDLMKKAVALRLLGKADMMELLRIGPMCVADWLNEWFETPILKANIAANAVLGTYMGPWSPSSNANLIVSEALRGRAVKGGSQALIAALYRACQSKGVEIVLGRSVKKILTAERGVRGVELEGGEQILCQTLAASCDPKTTFLKLMDSRQLQPSFEKRMLQVRARGTTAKVNIALKGNLNFACRPEYQPEFVRICTHLDGIEQSFDAVKYGEFSQTPLLDIYVPTISNPDFAPPGHTVLSILVSFVPYHLRAGWDEEQKAALYRNTLQVLQTYAPQISQNIVAHEVLSPLDLEVRYGVNEGHIHHGEHSADQILMRPTPECAKYKTPIAGLFVSGSGAHPGGGLTCLPGALAANEIMANR